MLEDLQNLKKAVEKFIPHLKNLNDQITVLEGKIDNLSQKRAALDKEIEDKIRKSDEVLALDKKRALDNVDQSERLLKEIHGLYLTVYKAKIIGEKFDDAKAGIFSKNVEAKEKNLAELKETVVV